MFSFFFVRLRPFADRIHLIIPSAENNISSSRVRKLLSDKKSIKYLVHPAVENYIYNHQLYNSVRPLRRRLRSKL